MIAAGGNKQICSTIVFFLVLKYAVGQLVKAG
jgi:hypothetical protein